MGASGSTRVVSSFHAATLGTLNAAGLRNNMGNRIDVDFSKVVFTLDRLLALGGGDGSGLLRKVVMPSRDPALPQPAVDVTYLDDEVRITRGGDGSLFILGREDSPMPMLRTVKRAELLQDEAVESVNSGPAFIKWLQTA